MAITAKIQRPHGAAQPVVAGGEPFSVRLDVDVAAEHGTLRISVAGAARPFARHAGGPKAAEHPVFVDQPTTAHVHDWGDLSDRGKTLEVSVQSAGETRKDSAPIL